MDCPEAIDLMDDALQGSVPPGSRGGFDEHMDECAACRTYYEQLIVTRRALALLHPTGDGAPRRSDLIDRFKETFGRD